MIIIPLFIPIINAYYYYYQFIIIQTNLLPCFFFQLKPIYIFTKNKYYHDVNKIDYLYF